jgi:hypothetical protein
VPPFSMPFGLTRIYFFFPLASNCLR